MAEKTTITPQMFTDRVAGLKIGEVVTIPPFMQSPKTEAMWLRLVSIDPARGLYTLDLSWLGVQLGTLCGKPTAPRPSWRFTGAPG